MAEDERNDERKQSDYDSTFNRHRRADERLVLLEERISQQQSEIHELVVAVKSLTESIAPIITERAMVLKFMRYWLGVWTGIGVSITAGIVVAVAIHYLKLYVS